MALTQAVVLSSPNAASMSEIENAVENMENIINGLSNCDECIVSVSMEEMDQFNRAVQKRKKRQTNTDVLYFVLSCIIEVNVEGEGEGDMALFKNCNSNKLYIFCLNIRRECGSIL